MGAEHGARIVNRNRQVAHLLGLQTALLSEFAKEPFMCAGCGARMNARCAEAAHSGPYGCYACHEKHDVVFAPGALSLGGVSRVGHPFAPELRQAWEDIAEGASAQRPSPGKRVRIVGGRKHVGRTGVVERHQVSKFDDPFRYGSPQQHQMASIRGRRGYVVLVRDEAGETFWVRADYTRVE